MNDYTITILTSRFGYVAKAHMKRKISSEIRRKEILVAAAKLFSSQGYHGVSVDAIARDAGTSKGNLYWHFNSKQEIFCQLFERLAGSLLMPIKEVLDSVSPPKQKLRSITRECIDTAEANPDVVRFGWQIITQPELKEMLTSQYYDWMEPFIDQLIPIFSELGERNPEDVARFYALTLDSFMGLHVMMPEIMEKEKILLMIEERFIDCLDSNSD